MIVSSAPLDVQRAAREIHPARTMLESCPCIGFILSSYAMYTDLRECLFSTKKIYSKVNAGELKLPALNLAIAA